MNRLQLETSPYLRQHATNPVDWYPWGPEAQQRARELDRPLLVSVGYAACHWCHVMAHESFADEQVAALMNAHFVCVKVDREERPDLDAVCMDACLACSGHGGWPLNVFMTPEQRPFFAGTYFPPGDRAGMPGWPRVLRAIADAWDERAGELRAQGQALSDAIAESVALPAASAIELPRDVIARSAEAIISSFEPRSGGWGGAPLFPAHCTLELLLAVGAADPHGPATQAALASLRAMAGGGIFDQLGGGFHRYSVDGTWTVPHFEKMLYDNALLARAYLHGYQVSGEPRLREVLMQTLDFALRELRGPEGGFCASLDADSDGYQDPSTGEQRPGGEGAFYVWTPDQVHAAQPDATLAELARSHFGVTETGNFEHGATVLTARAARTPEPDQLQRIRAALLSAREGRPRPALDDKRLTGWNALMVTALADAGAVLNRPDYLQAARDCAGFLLSELRGADGRLLRSWRAGRATLPAQLDDHAYLLQALIVLYEASFEQRWFIAALAVADELLERFADPAGGFFTTAAEQPVLVSRRKDMQDAPLPSGNAAAALGLLRLAAISSEQRYEQAAGGVLALLGERAARQPTALSHLLLALDFQLAPACEVALLGDDGAGPLARAYRARLRPHAVLAGSGQLAADSADAAVALLRGRVARHGQPTAYVCERFSCQLPVTEVAELQRLLGD